MIIFLLLVIIAILLFGSSTVIGAFGTILGCIAAILALVFAIQLWTSLSTAGQLLVFATPFIALGLLFTAAHLADRIIAWRKVRTANVNPEPEIDKATVEKLARGRAEYERIFGPIEEREARLKAADRRREEFLR